MPQGIGGFGVKLPPKTKAPSKKEQEEYDKAVLEAQERWGAGRKYIAGVLEGLGGASSIGGTGKPGARDYGKGTVDILTAGIPFGAFPKLLGGKVFHGSPAAGKIIEEGFNPSLYNRGDTLGELTHFAENPRYAENFANKMFIPDMGRSKPAIIPAKLDVQNVVDLYNPSIEDRAKLAGLFAPESWQRDAFRRGTSPQGYTSAVQELKPHQLKGIGIDALRYQDMQEPSWAVVDPEKIIGAYTGKPIGVSKSEMPKWDIGEIKDIKPSSNDKAFQDMLQKSLKYNDFKDFADYYSNILSPKELRDLKFQWTKRK